MESLKIRLNKLADNVINYRGVKERHASRQNWASNILSVVEVVSAITVVTSMLVSDFPGRIGVQVAGGSSLILSVLFLSLFHLRDRAFNNGIAAISLRRLERKLDRLRALLPEAIPKLEILEKEYEQMCDEYDKIELSNSTNSQYYQPNEKSFLSPYLIMNNPIPPAPLPPYHRQYPTEAPSYESEHVTVVTE